MSFRAEGITHPSIDELLETTESKFSLVIYAARRARQITGYYSQMGEYLLEYVGPLVEHYPQEKPMSIALREIHEGLVVATSEDPPDPTSAAPSLESVEVVEAAPSSADEAVVEGSPDLPA